MNNGVTAWAIIPSKYVNEAINNGEKRVQENMPGHKQGNRATNPFPTDYVPDLDTTDELDEDHATYYQSQLEFWIGLLNWEGLIFDQKYHFWLHMLHSQERDIYKLYSTYMTT